MRTPLPQAGVDWADLEPRMLGYAAGDVRWRDGKTAVYVFNAGPDVEQVQKQAYASSSPRTVWARSPFPA